MNIIIVSVVLGLAHISSAAPSFTLQDLEVVNDTVAVASYIRATRAVGPSDYEKSYENDGDGEIGFSRKKEGGGKKGYQYFDSYHKKAGDNYEFEKQDAYGEDEGKEAGSQGHDHKSSDDGGYGHHSQNYRLADEEEQEGAHSHRIENRDGRNYESDGDYYSERNRPYAKPKGKAAKLRKSRESSHEQFDEEKDHEELREDAADGNGGVEAHGHDIADYTLPEKYTYGKGDEYNF